MENTRHTALFISNTDNKGRGVYTKTALQADEIIEVAPVIVMSGEERTLLDKTLLHDYIFEWQPEGKQMCCMALGWVPVYNHAYNSNCEYFMEYDTDTIYIKTVRNIEAGEELTINYNGDWDDIQPVWFDVHQ